MNTDRKKAFLRNLKKITDPALKAEVEQVYEAVKAAKTMQGFPNLRKLKGFRTSYRIRIGDYRIGVTIVGDLVTFHKFGHRDNFYKKSFP